MQPDELIIKHYNGEATPEEEKELQKWIGLSASNRQVFEDFADLDYIKGSLIRLDALEKEAEWEKIMAGISKSDTPKHALPKWVRDPLAAVMILLILAVWLLWPRSPQPAKLPVGAAPVSQQLNDKAPGGNKAILTLADGSTRMLDSTGKGLITEQGNTRIEHSGKGQLLYNAINPTPGLALYNTLATPRAGTFLLTLSDGSKVWLNNASSLHYPIYFIGKDREVELSGEAYFEIARDAARPFTIKVNDMTVDVLGTSFNIMAYTDENAVKTTVLNGSVNVSRGDAHSLLKSGEQIQSTTSGLKLIDNVNTDAAVAWKNGFFHFDKADIPAVMRQIGRWYDLDVRIEGAIPTRSFTGSIGRDLQLSAVLEFLKKNDVHFTLEGQTLIVRP